MRSFTEGACHRARDALGVDDVAVVVGSDIATVWCVLESTGEQVRAIDDVQFDLGIGPVADVLTGGLPQACRSDIGSDDGELGLLAAGASRRGVGAVFAVEVALPVPRGLRAAVEMSRSVPGPLADPAAVAAHIRAITIAIADDLLVHICHPGATRTPWPAGFVGPIAAATVSVRGTDRRHLVAAAVAEIADATTMSVSDSLSSLRARAFRESRPLAETAVVVLEEHGSRPRP